MLNLVRFLLFLSITEAKEVSTFVDRMNADNYDRLVSPIEYFGESLSVSLLVPYQALVNIESNSQIVHVQVCLYLIWIDKRLAYNVSEIQKIPAIVPEDSVWRPSLSVYNSITTEFATRDGEGLASIEPNGRVTTRNYVTFELNCPLNVAYFPFDTQFCGMLLQVNGYPSDQLNLTAYTDYDENYTLILLSNPEWEFLDSRVFKYRYMEGRRFYDYIKIILKCKRNAQFYVLFLILPTALLTVAFFSAILLPFNIDAANKINFGLAGFLALIFMLTMVVSEVPRSTHFPVLGTWMIVQLMMTAIANLILIPIEMLKKCISERFKLRKQGKCFMIMDILIFLIFVLADLIFSVSYLASIPQNVNYATTYEDTLDTSHPMIFGN